MKEFVSKVLTTYKADTSDHKSKIRELSGEEKKLEQQRLKAAEQENRRLDDQIKAWTKVALGATAAVGVFKLAQAAAKAAMDDATKHGTAGVGAAKAWHDATLKWKGAVDQLLVSFGQLVIKMAPLLDMIGEAVAQITGMETRTEERIARDKYGQYSAALRGDPNNKFLQSREQHYFKEIQRLRAAPAVAATAEMIKTFDAQTDAANAWAREIRANAYKALEAKRREARGGRGGGIPAYVSGTASLDDFLGLGTATRNAGASVGSALGRTFENARSNGMRPLSEAGDDSSFRESMKYVREDMAGLTREMQAAQQIAQQNFLETIFGPVGQFQAYAEGFKLLTGAAATAFDAWITGSMSVGTAIKMAIAEGLRALSGQMLIESLKHSAFALGSLAFGDFRGAATHTAAAAAFGGAAFAAAGVAKTMGAGKDWTPSPPKSTGAGLGGSGYLGASQVVNAGGGGGGSHTTVINILDTDWDDRTPSQRRNALARAVKEGQQTRTSNIVMHR